MRHYLQHREQLYLRDTVIVLAYVYKPQKESKMARRKKDQIHSYYIQEV